MADGTVGTILTRVSAGLGMSLGEMLDAGKTAAGLLTSMPSKRS